MKENQQRKTGVKRNDGDGRGDVAVYRPTTGTWYIQRSAQGFYGQNFGTNGDVPLAGAYIP